MTIQPNKQGDRIIECTVTAPVNIAVIKYWGKRNTKLLLPTNSSLSLTLSQDHLKSKTTIRASPLFSKDQLFLNSIEEEIKPLSRFDTVLTKCRQLRQELEANDQSIQKISQYPLKIVSINNFPTAAGLPSSASGFAALTFCLTELYQLNLTLNQVSAIARLGSGSACRSLFGGFVSWEMGVLEDGTDSIAQQVAPLEHWSDMEALILVVSDTKKHTSSSAGMQTTVKTSALLQHRIANVEKSMIIMKKAILDHDFDQFAELTMRDSNQFHAVCLDTFPPIRYLTDVSFAVIELVGIYNSITATEEKKYKVAYTFDAGPNAVLYAPRENMAEIAGIINYFFPISNEVNGKEYYGRAYGEYLGCDVDRALVSAIEAKFSVQSKNLLKRVISTQIGRGPEVLASGFDAGVSLMSESGELVV